MSNAARVVSRFPSVAVLICATILASACASTPSTGPRPLVATPADRLPYFPGVDVVPLDHGAFEVRIHGRLVGDGHPLYVIDGHPTMLPANRGIDWLRPEDIARITILTNPADVAIYGPRGVNGVILITTKKGATPR